MTFTHSYSVPSESLVCKACGGPWVGQGHELSAVLRKTVDGEDFELVWICNGPRES